MLSRLDGMTAADPAPLVPPQLPPRPLTLDDVAALAAIDDVHRYELDEGTLVVMAPPDKGHTVIVNRIQRWLASHGYTDDEVLPASGVKIRERTSGRCPDLIVADRTVPDEEIWIDPAAVRLAVEVVSRGSEKVDRDVKPREYASAGIRQYWRVERGVKPTVHMYRLGLDEHGDRAYVSHEAVLLDELLDGEPPKL